MKMLRQRARNYVCTLIKTSFRAVGPDQISQASTPPPNLRRHWLILESEGSDLWAFAWILELPWNHRPFKWRSLGAMPVGPL